MGINTSVRSKIANLNFPKLSIARAYLDLINLTIHKGKINAEKEDELISVLVLPDVNSRPTALLELYSSASLPSNILTCAFLLSLIRVWLGMLFSGVGSGDARSSQWLNFWEGGSLQAADEQTRRMFWKWLFRNGRKIAQRDRSKLGDLVVWPDESGSLCKTSDLCEPRSGRVGTVLAGFIRRPHEQGSPFPPCFGGWQGANFHSRRADADEIADWLGNKLARFKIGSKFERRYSLGARAVRGPISPSC